MRVFDREELTHFMNRNLPGYMHGGVLRYAFEGCEPGSFLRCVFENDLVGAFKNADGENQGRMLGYAMVLYNCFPARGHDLAWGSPRAVREWIALGGQDALDAAREGGTLTLRRMLPNEDRERLGADLGLTLLPPPERG